MLDNQLLLPTRSFGYLYQLLRPLGNTIYSFMLVGLIMELTIQSVWSQDFKIFSEIHTPASDLPVSQNVTLFADDLICDFLMSSDVKPNPVEIVIFDRTRKQLVLLDIEREVKVEISDLQIIKLMDVLTRETLENETSSFLLRDEFTEKSDPDSEEMTFSSPVVTYRVKAKIPKNQAILPKYNDFLDNFTKLSVTDPRKIPPFSRLKLNSALKRKGWIATEVQVEISPNDFFKSPIEAYSKHSLVEGLSSKDRELVQMAKNYWVQFKLVDLPEYRKIPVDRGPSLSRRIVQHKN